MKKKELGVVSMIEEEEVPFGDPPRMYNYRCQQCSFESEMNEANVYAAYGWTKKRTKTSDDETVPVLECPKCSKNSFVCVD